MSERAIFAPSVFSRCGFSPRFQREKLRETGDEIADYFLADYTTLLKLKAPTWTRHDLQEAIEAVVTQKMRFTQASTKYGIPKGTLYDNILGKSKRMMILEETALDPGEETAVLEFCCDISVSPYNRRTKKSLNAILTFVERLRRKHDPGFMFSGLSGFRWWWAFCKKHSIVDRKSVV